MNLFKAFKNEKFKIKNLPQDKPARLLYICVSLALISGGAALILHFLASNVFGWSSTVVRETREVDSNRRVTISIADMPLEVYIHKGDKIRIEYIGETALIIEEDELELKISREEDFTLSLFSRDRLNYKMVVFLPERQYEEIKVYSASGSVYIEDLKTAALFITSRTGNIKLVNVDGIFDVNSRSGNVEIE